MSRIIKTGGCGHISDNFKCFECFEDIEKKLQTAREGLQRILSDKHNIGNDWNGNLKGHPDAIMCSNIAKQTLEEIDGKGEV